MLIIAHWSSGVDGHSAHNAATWYNAPQQARIVDVRLDVIAMQNSHHKPEIMSPAGYWPQLHAAIEAGADAVYFGMKHFSGAPRSASR